MELLHLNEVGNALPLSNLPYNECPSNCIAHSVMHSHLDHIFS